MDLFETRDRFIIHTLIAVGIMAVLITVCLVSDFTDIWMTTLFGCGTVFCVGIIYLALDTMIEADCPVLLIVPVWIIGAVGTLFCGAMCSFNISLSIGWIARANLNPWMYSLQACWLTGGAVAGALVFHARDLGYEEYSPFATLVGFAASFILYVIGAYVGGTTEMGFANTWLGFIVGCIAVGSVLFRLHDFDF